MKARLAATLCWMAPLFVACGGNATTTSSTAIAASRSPDAPTASPTPDPLVSAVLSAYEASVVAYDKAVREMNPEEPAIPATTTGNQVIHELTTLNQWKLQGITSKGDPPRVLDSHVVSSAANTADVVACVYDPGILIYASTGKSVPTNFAGQFYVNARATLKLVSGTWKVSDSKGQTEGSGCLAGY